MKEKELTDMDKIEIAISLFIKKKRIANKLPAKDKNDILQRIFDEFISTNKKTGKNDKRSFDFKQDFEYIYSSFMMDYGIDLYEQAGRLDWRKFIALFQGLSDKTKIVEIINIRLREIPISDKHNEKEIKALRELKDYYRLEGEENNNYQQGVASFGATLLSRAR